LNRKALFFFAAGLFFVTADRLPAPIFEVPTPTPAQSSRAKSKPPSDSRGRPSTVKKTADMHSQEVHVVFTDNTRATLLYLKDYVENYEKMPFAGKSDVHPNEITERLRQVLSNRFRNVSIATEGSSNRGAGGLVMVFDLQAHVGMMSFSKTTISFQATFKDGGGRPIQTLSAAGSGTIPYPAFGTRFPAALAAAFTDFSQKLGNVNR
jgi:hypothetical protein